MEVDVGGPDPVEVLDGPNYTYNVSPMFYEAFGDEGIRGLHGKVGAECKPLIDAALGKMLSDAAKYRAMNPTNGWGDYEGAVRLLKTLRDMCERAPLARMRVS